MPTDKELLEQVPGIGDTLARRLVAEFGEGSEVARAAANSWGQLTAVPGISESSARELFDNLRRAGVYERLRAGDYTPFLRDADVLRAGGSGHFMGPDPQPASPSPGWREPTTGKYTGFQINDPNIARETETGQFQDAGPDEPIPLHVQNSIFGRVPRGGPGEAVRLTQETELAQHDVSLAPDEAFRGVGAVDPQALGGFSPHGPGNGETDRPDLDDVPPDIQQGVSHSVLEPDGDPRDDITFIYGETAVNDEMSLSQFRQRVHRQMREMGGIGGEWNAASIVVAEHTEDKIQLTQRERDLIREVERSTFTDLNEAPVLEDLRFSDPPTREQRETFVEIADRIHRNRDALTDPGRTDTEQWDLDTLTRLRQLRNKLAT